MKKILIKFFTLIQTSKLNYYFHLKTLLKRCQYLLKKNSNTVLLQLYQLDYFYYFMSNPSWNHTYHTLNMSHFEQA